MRYITAILLSAAILWIIASCGGQGTKVVIRYPHHMGYVNQFRQEGSQMLQVWQADSLAYSITRSLNFDISQRVLRVLPDSTAAVEEKSTMVLISPNPDKANAIDTMKEDRSFILYEAPNGRIVDFESQTPLDSFSMAHFRSWYEQACPVFPDSRVGAGSTWTNHNTVKVDSQEFKTSTSFTVRGFERLQGYDCIVVEYSGNVILPLSMKPTDSSYKTGLDEIRIDGTFWFAYEDGFFVDQRQKEVVEGWRKGMEKGKEFQRRHRSESDVRMYLVERKRS